MGLKNLWMKIDLDSYLSFYNCFLKAWIKAAKPTETQMSLKQFLRNSLIGDLFMQRQAFSWYHICQSVYMLYLFVHLKEDVWW